MAFGKYFVRLMAAVFPEVQKDSGVHYFLSSQKYCMHV